MSLRSINECLDNYQRARLCFVRTIYSFTEKPFTMELLQGFEFLDLIIPLLNDRVHSIQHAALATLGKLTQAKPLIQEILNKGVMRTVLRDFNQQNKLYKKTALQVLTDVMARDERFAVLTDEDVQNIISCLREVDADSKISTAMALGNMLKNNPHLTERFVQAGVLSELLQTLCSPNLSVKHAAAFALSNLVKHSSALAEDAVTCNIIPLLINAIGNEHNNLKQSALRCLADIARHNHNLASKVVEGGAIPIAVAHLSHSNLGVQENAAILLRDICKHQDHRLVTLVEDAGGIQGLIKTLECPGDGRSMPATIGLGYLASQSAKLAQQILAGNGVAKLHCVLQCPTSEMLQVSAAWTLGQAGKHSADNVAMLCKENVLSTLLTLSQDEHASEDIRNKFKDTLRLLLSRCTDWEALEDIFLRNTSDELLPPILNAFAKILPCHAQARRSFVMSQCLKKLRTIESIPCIETSREIIYKCFSEEILNFASPTYIEDLINKYYPEESIYDQLPGMEARNPSTIAPMGSPDSCTVAVSEENIGISKSVDETESAASSADPNDVSWSD